MKKCWVKNRKCALLMSLLLASVLVLSGCGSDNAGADSQTGSADSQTQAGGADSMDTSGVGAEDGSDSETGDEATGESTEKEVYVLEFEATTTEGEAITSDIFAESKLTMINVWATYCNPCLAEMPDLGEIATEYDKADFQMIGIISDVMNDASKEDMDYAKQLIAETGATTYPHLTLNTSLYMNLVGSVQAVPTTFFVNQRGELLGYLMGSQAKVTWKALIDDLLVELE